MAFEFVDIPLPSSRTRAAVAYPFGDLVVGGKALVIDDAKLGTVKSKAAKFAKAQTPAWKFKVALGEGDKVFVWRLA